VPSAARRRFSGSCECEDLANEFIARFLTAASADGSSAVRSTVPAQALLRLVKTLQVRATEGVVTVHFEIRA